MIEAPRPVKITCTPSTNNLIASAFNDQTLRPFSSIVAWHQSAGRGRSGHSWFAPAGSSLLTSVATTVPEEVPPHQLGWVPLAAALALSDLVKTELPRTTPQIKWPNDVLLEDRKVAGILAEHLGAHDGLQWICIGVGLNLVAAPEGATSLLEHGWMGASSTEELAHRLSTLLRDRLERFETIPEEYRSACATLGKLVNVELSNGGSFTDVATSIDADGALIVGGTPVTAADVSLSTQPPHLNYATTCKECQ